MSSRNDAQPWSRFLRIYGWLGIPMLLAFVLSALWSAMLALIQLVPNAVANTLMGTTDFDFGEFWLITEPDLRIAVPSAVALGVFAIGYGYLGLAMVFPRTVVISPQSRISTASSWLSVSAHRVQSHIAIAHRHSIKISDVSIPAKCTLWSKLGQWARRLGAFLYHNRDSAVLAVPKLAFQSTTLITYLREGFPIVLISTYSILLVLNWMFTSYRSALNRPEDPHLIHVRLFNSFDLFFAVFAPLHVLLYAYDNFKFDHEVFATRVAALPPDSFDRTARLFADPTEVSLFRIAFEHMQLTTPTQLCIKIGLNTFTIARLYFVIAQLTISATPRLVTQTEPINSGSRVSPPVRMKRWRRIHRFLLGLMFGGAGAGIFTYSIVTVVSSLNVCRPLPQCKVPSFQWNVHATHCSCIVFVDREVLVTTMAEWVDPPSAADSLAQSAHTGHLKIVQIINRQVPYLPLDLRQCTNLEQLILIYTKTLAFPDWADEFSRLQYLHLEGDLTSKQLTYLPRNLFENMPRLSFIHFGCLIKLPFVPDLNNLVRLDYLVLAMLHQIVEIPSIDRLVNLKKLTVVDNIRLLRLPLMHTLRSLSTFALGYRTPVCCNGFISGKCDLTEFSCLDRTAQGEPLVACATDHILPDDRAVIESTHSLVCPPNLPFDMKDIGPTVETTDHMCGGVMYKQCRNGNITGICYPARMQPVSCQLDPDYTNLRRVEITRGVGKSCDPSVEGWLGCK